MNSNKTVTGSFGVIKKKDDLCKKISREEYIDRIQRSTWDQKTKDRLIDSSKDMPFFSWCAYYEW